MKRFHFYILHFLIIFLHFSICLKGQLVIIPDKTEGVYNSGETVKFILQQDSTISLKSVRYTLKKGNHAILDQREINFVDNKATVSYTFDNPGSVLLEVRWGSEDTRRNKVIGGAIADPDEMVLSSAKPVDFDDFWQSKLNVLDEIPMNPLLKKGDSGVDGVNYWTLSLNNIRSSLIHGQLARPVKGRKFPAMLIVQWAGVYPLQKNWVTDRAREGWLVLNINAHDLPIDEKTDFYRKQSQGELRNYWSIGNEDRETSYFLRMYLSCYRAASYLTNRSDWNGKTLVVMGDSQGGQQALMVAGLFPEIKACLALVPAGFDMLGPDLGRKGGWPQWYDQTEGKDAIKVRETSRYFDVANFIPGIKCPVLVGVGLLDETCPPEGILAGLNQLSSPKEVLILPESGHQDRNGTQEYYRLRKEEVWLPALRAGKKAPVNKKKRYQRLR